MPTIIYKILIDYYGKRYCVPKEQQDVMLVAESMGYIRCMLQFANDEQKVALNEIFNLSAALLIAMQL